MEAADSLYGVSMGGDGISKVISRRLPPRRPPPSRPKPRPSYSSCRCNVSGAAARWPATGRTCSSSTARPRVRRPSRARAAEEKRVGRFRRLRENLRKTRQALTSEIQATLFEDLSDETWERLEEALIYADVGATDDGQGRRAARAGGDRWRDHAAARR